MWTTPEEHSNNKFWFYIVHGVMNCSPRDNAQIIVKWIDLGKYQNCVYDNHYVCMIIIMFEIVRFCLMKAKISHSSYVCHKVVSKCKTIDDDDVHGRND